ncbi:hypothetical protein V6N13_081375 [Hibiscus sabdariffa]|uniref:Uncharacterized protein n=1 Tax=Hibiscus sabdariffa TaxID=183260 RepID=A0ABR2DCX4_9ROSI
MFSSSVLPTPSPYVFVVDPKLSYAPPVQNPIDIHDGTKNHSSKQREISSSMILAVGGMVGFLNPKQFEHESPSPAIASSGGSDRFHDYVGMTCLFEPSSHGHN